MDDHNATERVPYGRWPSLLTPEVIGAGRISMSGLKVVGDRCWWSESRPAAGGRQVVVRAWLAPVVGGATAVADASPHALDVRSRVHEYGGGGFTVLANGDLVVADAADGALWWVGDIDDGKRAGRVRRLTPVPPEGERHRYGDMSEVPGTRWVVAVRERHLEAGATPGEGGLQGAGAQGAGSEQPVVIDDLVVVAVDRPVDVRVLVAGHDFFAAPRPSPDGRRLAYLWWDHPRMPWDGSHLEVRPLDGLDDTPADVAPVEARGIGHVAGGDAESVGQPQWVGQWLWFVTDRCGYWQPWRWSGQGPAQRMADQPVEFHGPDWTLGVRTMAPLDGVGSVGAPLDGAGSVGGPLDGAEMVVRFRQDGRDRIGVIDPSSGQLEEVAQPWVTIAAVAAHGRRIVVLGATNTEPQGVGIVEPDGTAQWLATPTPTVLPAHQVSKAQPTTFSFRDGQEGHMLVYQPVPGPGVVAGPGRPPLLVLCHGGPTGACEPGMDLQVQSWTSRGFMVAAVDYRGSSGYGRAYRLLLQGRWGEVDALDVQDAARHLVDRSMVDRQRMVVRGSSAGGLTALAAATADGPFRAAVVAYGVSDLGALAATTHKFEAHYLDSLVGPWPAARQCYEERSPALHPERIGASLLLLQGSDDPIVPPAQAVVLADAVRQRGLRCDHVVFPGEGHGFRRAETVRAAAELEIRFVQEVLDLT